MWKREGGYVSGLGGLAGLLGGDLGGPVEPGQVPAQEVLQVHRLPLELTLPPAPDTVSACTTHQSYQGRDKRGLARGQEERRVERCEPALAMRPFRCSAVCWQKEEAAIQNRIM